MISNNNNINETKSFKEIKIENNDNDNEIQQKIQDKEFKNLILKNDKDLQQIQLIIKENSIQPFIHDKTFPRYNYNQKIEEINTDLQTLINNKNIKFEWRMEEFGTNALILSSQMCGSLLNKSLTLQGN